MALATIPAGMAEVVYVPVSRRMIEQMNGRWSEHPLFVKVEVRDDGTAEMWFQRPAPHGPACGAP